MNEIVSHKKPRAPRYPRLGRPTPSVSVDVEPSAVDAVDVQIEAAAAPDDRVAVPKPTAGAGLAALEAISSIEDRQQAALVADDRQRAEALIAPHREAGHAAIKTFERLAREYGERLRRAASLNVPAILKRVPADVAPGRDYSPNHFRIAMYVHTARELAETVVMWKPTDHPAALAAAEGWAAVQRPEDGEFRRAYEGLKFHTGRLSGFVRGFDERVIRWLALENLVTADLANAVVLDAEPAPRVETLPLPQEAQPSAPTRGWEDPRVPPPPEDDLLEVVRFVDGGAGIRPRVPLRTGPADPRRAKEIVST